MIPYYPDSFTNGNFYGSDWGVPLYFINSEKAEQLKDLRQTAVDIAIREENKASIEKLLLYPFILIRSIFRKEPERLQYKRAPRKRPP